MHFFTVSERGNEKNILRKSLRSEKRGVRIMGTGIMGTGYFL